MSDGNAKESVKKSLILFQNVNEHAYTALGEIRRTEQMNLTNGATENDDARLERQGVGYRSLNLVGENGVLMDANAIVQQRNRYNQHVL